MNTQDFYFDLPETLIAQYPPPTRSEARLLVYNRQTAAYSHRRFNALAELLEAGDLLVMNNTKVIPARFFGVKETGGKVEFLLERLLDRHAFWAHIKASKAPKPGTRIYLENKWELRVIAKKEALYHCRMEGDVENMLQEIGHIPLPPYINRSDEPVDVIRYQTIYAMYAGSVAAPTAGLHFDESVLALLQKKGIKIAYATLHVGAGTFQPVRCERLTDHKMHSEYYEVSEALCAAVNETHAAGKRVIAVGTTAMRSLESAAQAGYLHPYRGETTIFIYPGFEFKICDGLLTNFHLPESTLLMLVAAFIGHPQAMALYREAIAKRYRFFSYGDASLLL